MLVKRIPWPKFIQYIVLELRTIGAISEAAAMETNVKTTIAWSKKSPPKIAD